MTDQLTDLTLIRSDAGPADLGLSRIHRLEEVRAVLEGAVAVLRRGWVQEAFFLVRSRRGRVRAVGPLDFTVPRNAEVIAACLVGAIVHAGRLHKPAARGPDHYPALDRAWAALHEQHAPVTSRAEPALHPAARARQVRDLTIWNDAPGRTGADVERLLDVAISGSILEAVQPRSLGRSPAGA